MTITLALVKCCRKLMTLKARAVERWNGGMAEWRNGGMAEDDPKS